MASRASAALDAFLDSLIDYAGLFPPSGLPLERALEQYLSHLAEPEFARYLGCFVIPVGLLSQASALLRQGVDGDAVRPRFSVLGGPDDAPGSIAAAVREFEASTPGARVAMLELKTAPPDGGRVQIAPLLDGIDAAFSGDRRHVFVEVDWRSDPSPVMALLSDRQGVGVKLRSGGLTADLVPPPDAAARFLQAAAQFRLPLKFTAGLHVPVPNDDAAVGARMHGFLNMMAAAMAAYRGHAPMEALVETLERLSYPDFGFDEEGFRAGALCFGVSEVEGLRRHIRGFGSCSFLEPLEYLAEHGLSPALPCNQEPPA